jgi:hypothetical protein
MFLTLTTAGVASTFDLVLKDQFGNIRDNNDDAVAVSLAVRTSGQYFSFGVQSIIPTYAYATAGNPSGRYTVEYIVTHAGLYRLSVSAGDGSSTGLWAQYGACRPNRYISVSPPPQVLQWSLFQWFVRVSD